MGPSVTSCTTTVYGFGDNTAGPIWAASLPEKQGLIGSYTNMTNAPFGDDLSSPIGYSLITQSILIKITTGLAGPICGYNIANIIGFILSALVMFGFVYEITKSRWIALLAGYAVSFSPYFQMKIGNHFSFGFQAIFIGLIWLFYRLLKNKKKKDAILLGLLFVISVYWDPYFSLLAAIVMASLGLTWLVINKKIFTIKFWSRENHINNAKIKHQLSLFFISISIIVALVIPLIVIISSQSGQINANVAASRGNVLAETKACSNWPHEYFVPFVLNPIFRGLIGDDRYVSVENSLRDGFSCGLAEDSVGLSLVLLSIVLLGSAAFVWKKLNKRKIGLSAYLGFEPKILVYGLVSMAIIAAIIALPPLKIHNLIPTPSYELLQITSIWRTLTRIVVIVNIALVLLSAIFITYFYKHFNLGRHLKLTVVLFIVICAGIFIEYQSFAPFSGNKLSTFNYTKDVPPQYIWLRDQTGIKTIAEYPLERSGGEGNSMAYYLTMQVLHKKKLFNSALSYSPQEDMKTGLKNLSDPQTVSVLKAMGVDAIVVHGVDASELNKIPNVKTIYSASQVYFNILGSSPIVKNDIVNVISLQDVKPQDYVIALGKGFARNMEVIKSAVDWQYETTQDSIIEIKNLEDAPNEDGLVDVCFDIKMASPGDSDVLSIIVDGEEAMSLTIDDNYKTVKTQANKQIIIHNAVGHNMRVTGIGCRS